MGVCDSSKYIDQINEVKEDTQAIENDKISQNNVKNNRINECIIEENNAFESIDISIYKISKSICKIIIRLRGKNIIGSGFLLKFDINQELFCCLISNEHIINQDIINNNNIIHIYYDTENKNIYKEWVYVIQVNILIKLKKQQKIFKQLKRIK